MPPTSPLLFNEVKKELGKVIVGQEALIDKLFIALLSDGHLLLEGLPGLAKTLAVTSLAKVIQCDFKRVQFTPDLLPSDILGSSIYHPKEGTFEIKKGPVFTNLLLADEINRAPAKVQSALLEVMQERQVTIGGETFKAPLPYLVLATQNPIEQEGTYPLPEAQTDRFMMKVKIGYPTKKEEKKILEKMATTALKHDLSPLLTPDQIEQARKEVDAVFVDEKIADYIIDLIFATRDPEAYNVPISGLLLFGASPRAGIALKMAAKARSYLLGRSYVTPGDIKELAHDVLRHRLRRSYEAEAEEITADSIIDKILDTIQVP